MEHIFNGLKAIPIIKQVWDVFKKRSTKYVYYDALFDLYNSSSQLILPADIINKLIDRKLLPDDKRTEIENMLAAHREKYELNLYNDLEELFDNSNTLVTSRDLIAALMRRKHLTPIEGNGLIGKAVTNQLMGKAEND